MKKFLTAVTVALAGLTLVGCGSTSSSSSSASESSQQTVKHLKVGQTATLTNNGKKVQMTVTGIQHVDPSNSLVADVSSNYKKTKEFVLYSYSIKSLSDNVSANDFDGTNLKLLDSQKSTGIVSSNRSSVTPDTINKGETVNYQIGVGYYHTGDKAYIGIDNQMWSGKLSE
ncbi:hypothetical protein [Limosilactobacillus fermentum]|uniref:hypothetical protein n=1 Tax=Limosilactobacillus fermentum TaxID=1613 RepID=UPI0037C118EE